MIFNMAAGANAFNFAVTGGTVQPVNPAENTLWVNTDKEITGWLFDAGDPFVGSIAQGAGVWLGSSEDYWGEVRYTYTKAKVGRAALMHCIVGTDGEQYCIAMLMSRDKDACEIVRQGTDLSGNSTGTEIVEAANSFLQDGETFYYAYVDVINQFVDIPVYTSLEEPARALLGAYNGEGKAWFRVDTSAELSFNALRKNGIQIYPVAAAQFVNGEWVEKQAQLYQNGEWFELDSWNGDIFNAGEQYADITGGWVKGEGNASATINDSGITLTTSSNSANRIHVETAKAVDLTDFTTLYAKVNVSSISLGSGVTDARVRLGYAASSGANLANSSTKVEKQVTAKGEITLQLDISAAKGAFHIVLGGGFYSITVKPEHIWME